MAIDGSKFKAVNSRGLLLQRKSACFSRERSKRQPMPEEEALSRSTPGFQKPAA